MRDYFSIEFEKDTKSSGKEDSAMKRNILLGVLAFFSITALTMVDTAQAVEHAKMSKVSYAESAVNLRMAMRKLWEDHITYTRNYIISALADLGDTGKVA